MFSEGIKKKAKTEYLPVLLTISALFIFALAAGMGMRYIPENAVTMMADINRIDFFGTANMDFMVILGYYIKRYLGVSQAKAVCMIIPLCLYCLYAALLFCIADCLFADSKLKRSLCFLAEAFLVFLWDCKGSPAFFALHGMICAEGIVLTLALPYVFLCGIRICFYDREDTADNGKSIWRIIKGVCRGLLFVICVLSALLFSKKALGLMLLSICAFVLLIIIRRYLPWLRSSE